MKFDGLIVARKELLELVGERAGRRGVQIQALFALVIGGIYFPSTTPRQYLGDSPLALAIFLVIPALIAGTISSDAFAGERERRTLETLLATPLSDRAIVAGKAIAAITAAAGIAILCLIAATITLNVTAKTAGVFIPAPEMCLGALGATVAFSCVVSAIAIFLSMRVAVARSVQQMVSLMFMLPLVLGGVVWSRLGIALTWPNVFIGEAIVLAIGLLALFGANLGFRRDRLFVNR